MTPRSDVLIGSDDLPEALTAGAQLLDVRWNLGEEPGSGHRAFVAGHLPDRVDDHDRAQLVAGVDGPVVDEALVAVHHPGEVQTQLGVEQHRVLSAGDCGDGERRRCDEVGVAGLAGRLPVVAPGRVLADGVGELADLLHADQVRLVGRERAAGEGGVHHDRRC